VIVISLCKVEIHLSNATYDTSYTFWQLRENIDTPGGMTARLRHPRSGVLKTTAVATNSPFVASKVPKIDRMTIQKSS